MKRLKTKYLVLRDLLGMLLILPLFIQCTKTTDLGLSLAVNSNELHLEALEGKTHIMIYANGAWTVQFKESVDWISVNKLEGYGNSDVEFSYAQNFGAARSVTLVLTKGGETQEIQIIQNGLDVALRFSKNRFLVPKHALPTILPIISNVSADFKLVDIEYLYDDETSEEWIANGMLTEQGFSFDALENNAGRNRSVRIYLTLVDAFDNEYMSFADVDQSLETAVLTQKYRATSQLTRAAKLDTVILRGNVGVHFPLIETSVTYAQGANWIEDVTLANDSLLVLAVRENDSGLARSADVHLTLSIHGINLVDLTHQIFQSNADFETISFESVRNMITASSGTTTINAPLKVLEGIVISDEGNANMETNPNLTFNTINMNETYRTAYIQSADGRYGFRLKFNAQSENTLKRYSKVLISIDGLTLQKEANPGRYTIQGIGSGAVVSTESGTAANITDKLRYVSELADADLYTHVTMRDVGVSIPYGSYMNLNGGYLFRTAWNTVGVANNGAYTDAIPTRIFDAQGADMNMLVNASVPWARSTVPGGSGTISGIITHDKLLRFGGGEGDIGRYALRPVDQNSVQLTNPSLATTLVEWNWIGNGTSQCAARVGSDIVKDGAGNVLPAIGTGTLSCTVQGAATGVGAHPVCNTNPDHNGVYNNAFQYTNVKWWNADQQSGEGIILRFSTNNITAQSLILNFSMGGGSGSDATNHIPTYWEIAYSLDGLNYTLLPNSTYAVRPLTQWNTNRPYQVPGMIPFTFRLPNSLLEQPNVYVKLKAKSNVSASATGAEDGRITSAMAGTTMRLGVLSVKYIQ